jgi:hypothetical protein
MADVHFWASIQSGNEKKALEEVNLMLADFLCEPATKRQGNISWRCSAEGASNPCYVNALASLKRCEYVHVLLARCFLQGRDATPEARKEEMLLQVQESAAGVDREQAKQAIRLWRQFYEVEHALTHEIPHTVAYSIDDTNVEQDNASQTASLAQQREGMKKLKKTPNLPPPFESTASGPTQSAIAFRMMGKRGGKHPFSSDDVKRAAAKGIALGLGNMCPLPFLVLADLHYNTGFN